MCAIAHLCVYVSLHIDVCRIVVVFEMNITFYSSVSVCFCVLNRDGVRKNVSGPRKYVWFIL